MEISCDVKKKASSMEKDNNPMNAFDGFTQCKELSNEFIPFYEVFTWLEPGTKLRWVIVVADLPFAIMTKDVTMSFASGRLLLEIKAHWSAQLSNPITLHKFLFPLTRLPGF